MGLRIISYNVQGLKTKFYISLIFSFVSPPCKPAPGGALYRSPLEMILSCQTTLLYVLTKISEGKVDQRKTCFGELHQAAYCTCIKRSHSSFMDQGSMCGWVGMGWSDWLAHNKPKSQAKSKWTARGRTWSSPTLSKRERSFKSLNDRVVQLVTRVLPCPQSIEEVQSP